MKIRDLFIPTKSNKYQAHLLKMESIVVFTLVILASNFFLGPHNRDINAAVDFDSVFYLQNKERTKHNLNELTINNKLIESATMKAKAMLDSNCWDHYCPPGVSPWKTFKDVGYDYLYAGENLAEGFTDNKTLMNAWMNSPTHRENVLKSEFTEVGVGFAHGDYQGIKDNTIVAVHFGHPYSPDNTIPTNTTINYENTPQVYSEETGENLIQPSSYENVFGLNWSIESIDTRTKINISVILFISLLLVIDYMIVRKYHLIHLNIHERGNHYIKLSILLIVGFSTIAASGIGSVLTGLSV